MTVMFLNELNNFIHCFNRLETMANLASVPKKPRKMKDTSPKKLSKLVPTLSACRWEATRVPTNPELISATHATCKLYNNKNQPKLIPYVELSRH